MKSRQYLDTIWSYFQVEVLGHSQPKKKFVILIIVLKQKSDVKQNKMRVQKVRKQDLLCYKTSLKFLNLKQRFYLRMHTDPSQKYKVKLIKLLDTYTDNSREFPYIHRVSSNIRFRLRSRITYDHEPVLLIEKLNSFDYILPLTQEFDLSSKACQDNFIVLKGKFDPDGAWYVELPEKSPGIVSFQVAFVPYGSTKAVRYGTHDVVFLTQDDNELRKLRKQTVFPRCIGTQKDWTGYFLRQMDLGYNSFHFAPIQQTGNSKSYYSLKDHLDLSEDLFTGTKEEKYGQLKAILTELKSKGVVFFIDIVLNHCSFDAEWIRDNSDAVYTPENTPILRPAFEVDDIIYRWGNQIKNLFSTAYEGQKLQFNDQFVTQIELNLRKGLYDLNLEEYFILSQQVQKTLLATVAPRKPSQNLFAKDPIELIQNFIQANICDQCTQKRQVKLKNLHIWKQLNIAYEVSDLKLAINYYNTRWIKKIKQLWIPQIVLNTINQVRHNYLHNTYRDFDDPYPFVSKYFSKIPKRHSENEHKQCFYALNNGWVAGADSRENFALSQQFYYLRRRVNVWGDLLRIRYGEKPSDSPYAWEYMKKYVQTMAQLFDGFRLDNCHGTQLNVARYMVKQARVANPNVIIFAQLFTNNDQQKALFVRSIGINAVLKQAQHMLSGPAFTYNIYDSLGKGATYVGGLNRYMEERSNEIIKYSTRKKPILLVYDLTHDNMTYCEKKIQVLQTPVTVLISLMGAFIGSTKGYDQFYARKVEVIQANQIYSDDNKCHPQIDKSQIQKIKFTYPSDGIKSLSVMGSWDGWKYGTDMTLSAQTNLFEAYIEVPPGHYEYKFFSPKTNEWKTHPSKDLNQRGNHQHNLPGGQLAYKTICNNLQSLRKDISKIADKYFYYSEYFNYHKNDVVVIIREGEDHEGSVCVIANLSTRPQKITDGIELFGEIVDSDIWLQSQFTLYEGFCFISEIVHSKNLKEYFDITFNKEKGNNVLITGEIPVGFACVIECRKTKQRINTIREVRDLVNRPIKLPQINALQANMIMYGSSREQQNIYGSSNYTIPHDNNKQLVYGGFGGIFIAIKNAKKDNDLSIKLFDNLREGNWLLDYYVARLKRYPSLTQFTDKIQKVFNSIKNLQRYLVPKYFSDFVYRICHAVQNKLSNNTISIFQRKLKTASTQFINKFPNQKPGFEILFAAGLPHFSTGWARCWGRDTFTSNQLLLEFPHIYKITILQFASALRHGMIPNLLDNGNNPRYNCRDACWWFIRGVKEYARKTHDYQILKEKVNMLFLSNDMMEHNQMKKQGKTKTMTVEEIIHEIIQSHAHGVFYREWRAGYEIDSNMMTEGFNIQLTVDERTGFINGGNQLNCLTWMDKMGSSIKAGNKGYPATPRAGEPVELVGLLYHCLTHMHRLHEEGHYAFDEVVFKKRKIKYSEWAGKIKQNFEKEFYIPEQKSSSSIEDPRNSQSVTQSHEGESTHDSKIHSAYVRLRGIYRDVCRAKIINEEYRLRPNALITLALAPQIINPEHARAYLANVQAYLLFPKSIGISTLAEIHESLYMPYYDNSDNSTQIKSAHGFSYHNGPQWVWLYGFYVTAKIRFDSANTTKEQLLGLLQEHNNWINNDEWSSLPEMTNKNGQFNSFSCPAQAWSVSSLLMAWNAIQNLSQHRDERNGNSQHKHHKK